MCKPFYAFDNEIVKAPMQYTCPHCDFLAKTFVHHPDSTNREYWLMTEVFVYLHGKDSCTYVKDHTCPTCGDYFAPLEECLRCN